MLIDKKTIRVIFEFEPENDTEKLALRDLIGVNVVNAVTRFKTDKKTVEDAVLFFQKINDIINIDDLLGN